MTELQISKFIDEHCVEWHREDNKGKPDIIIFVYTYNLEDFCEIAKTFTPDYAGLEMNLRSNYVAIWMNDLFEYFNLDMDKVFVGERTH